MKNKLAKNTMFLYVRMFFVMVINFYISRIVLSLLGVVDYGIYNVVGGFVAIFSMFSNSISASISRFLTIEIGKNDLNSRIKIFSNAKTIHLILAFILLIIGEIFGLWFLNNKMNIPIHRLDAANFVFHISIVTFFFNLIIIPYKAIIIAYEKMGLFAIIGIVEVCLNLFVVLIIQFLSFDSLILYAFFLFIVSVFIRGCYIFYSKKNFIEANCSYGIDKNTLKELGAFAGWNFIGSTSTVMSTQGLNVLLNIFEGPVINAARGISIQVNNAVASFSNNFMLAINPQITKRYAVNNLNEMKNLIFQGSKYSAFLLIFIILPILLNTEPLLNFWLREVPDNTVSFTKLILIYVLVESISYPLITGMLATGNIRKYQITVGLILLLNFPVTYILLYYDFTPKVAFIVPIIVSHFCLLVRVFMLSKAIHFSKFVFFKSVYLKIFLVFIVSLKISQELKYEFFYRDQFLDIFINSALSVITVFFSIYIFGLTSIEKIYLKSKIKSLF